MANYVFKVSALARTHAFRCLVKSLTALLIGSNSMSSHSGKAAFSSKSVWLRLQFVIPFQHAPYPTGDSQGCSDLGNLVADDVVFKLVLSFCFNNKCNDQ